METTTDHIADGDTLQADGNAEGLNKSEQLDKTVPYDTHHKALHQRAKFKEERDAAMARLAEIEQKELEAKGEHSKVIESLRSQLSEKESKINEMQSNYGWNVVGSQIKAEFASRGIKNADKALKFASSVHKDDLSTIEVDDQYNVNKEDLGRFVDKFLNDNADMNWIGKVSVKDNPNLSGSSDSPSSIAKDKISKMSADELVQKLWAMEGRKK